MSVLPVTAADVPVLASLHAQCFADAWSGAAFERFLQSENVFPLLARDASSNATGFIVVRVAADEAEILSLGVAPRCRRRSFARQLVLAGAAMAFGRGAATLFLEVGVDNAAACALYRQLGFEERGRRRGYYAQREAPAQDALIFRRALPIPAWESGRNSTNLGAMRPRG
jgi:[ribosomal protein S18]-alanine N-acetyltransferase